MPKKLPVKMKNAKAKDKKKKPVIDISEVANVMAQIPERVELPDCCFTCVHNPGIKDEDGDDEDIIDFKLSSSFTCRHFAFSAVEDYTVKTLSVDEENPKKGRRVNGDWKDVMKVRFSPLSKCQYFKRNPYYQAGYHACEFCTNTATRLVTFNKGSDEEVSYPVCSNKCCLGSAYTTVQEEEKVDKENFDAIVRPLENNPQP